MHRPLRIPFHVRVWNLVKGLLFYNTWNWEKASDGLNMPTLSREEREQRRPKADLEIIKPREKPRARLDLRQKTPPPDDKFQAQVSEPPLGVLAGEFGEGVKKQELPPPSAHPPEEYIKRRRYKRKRTNSSTGGDSFFRRVFGRQ